jgi:hypothetical protein
MIIKYPLFGRGLKTMGLMYIIAAILFSANIAIGTTQDQQRGEQQVESDEGLTVTLNGDSFRRGDTITVSGTVEERDIDSFAVIEVIDPESQTVVSAYHDITADNTFTHSFTAGEAEGVFDKPMTVSGNYRMTVSYTVPGEGFEREEVEFIFEYDAELTTTPSSSSVSRGGATAPLTIFQSNVDGISVGVPEGWIVDDTDNTDPINQNTERNNGAGLLAVLCPQVQATPVIGGGADNVKVTSSTVSHWEGTVAEIKPAPISSTKSSYVNGNVADAPG